MKRSSNFPVAANVRIAALSFFMSRPRLFISSTSFSNVLVKTTRELGQFGKLSEIRTRQKFGVLTFLKEEEIAKIVSKLPLAGATEVLSHLPEGVLGGVLRSVSPATRLALAGQLQKPIPQLTEVETIELEQCIRRFVDELSRELLSTRNSPEQVLRTLVLESFEVPGLVEEIVDFNREIATKHADLFVTPKDLLKVDGKRLSPVLQSLDNESLSVFFSVFSESDRQRLTSTLSPLRRSIISGVMPVDSAQQKTKAQAVARGIWLKLQESDPGKSSAQQESVR